MPLRALVHLSLFVLRLASHATFLLEAQRLLLRVLQPVAANRLPSMEQRLLSSVRTPLAHLFVPDAHGHSIHVIHAAHATPTHHVVLLHGHSMSAAFWYRNFDHLVALRCSVWAIDLLGWGRSERPPFRGSSAHDSVQWFLQSLSAVIDALCLPVFTLVGHSLGAYLSIEYTKQHPDRVRHLVMLSPAASVRPIPVSRAVYFWLPPQRIVRRGGLLGFLLFSLKYPRAESYVRDRLREYTYHLAAQMPPSGETAVRPIIRFCSLKRAECVRPIVEVLTLFPVPVTIVCGSVDSSMPVEGVYELYHSMSALGFDVALHVVDGSDHCPMLEKPHEFLNIMSSVLKTEL
ncbi:unnamed protein product [Agarophyton chilense]